MRLAMCCGLLLVWGCGPPAPPVSVDDAIEPAELAEPDPSAPQEAHADPVHQEHEGAAPAADDHNVAFTKAKPVFDKFCGGCHTKDGYATSSEAIEHLDMSQYPFGGHHADEIGKSIRTSVGAAGKPATMPAGATDSLKGDDLKLIVAWCDAFDKAQPAKKKDAGHDHSGHKH